MTLEEKKKMWWKRKTERCHKRWKVTSQTPKYNAIKCNFILGILSTNQISSALLFILSPDPLSDLAPVTRAAWLHPILETNQHRACFELGITLCDTAAYWSLYTNHEVHIKPGAERSSGKRKPYLYVPSKSPKTHHFRGGSAMRWV